MPVSGSLPSPQAVAIKTRRGRRRTFMGAPGSRGSPSLRSRDTELLEIRARQGCVHMLTATEPLPDGRDTDTVPQAVSAFIAKVLVAQSFIVLQRRVHSWVTVVQRPSVAQVAGGVQGMVPLHVAVFVVVVRQTPLRQTPG